MTLVERPVPRPALEANKGVVNEVCGTGTTGWRSAWRWLVMFGLIVTLVIGFTLVEVWWLWGDASWKPLLFVLTVVRHLIELLCIAYAVCFVGAAIRYIRIVRAGSSEPAPDPADCSENGTARCGEPIAVIYLCCNDLEEQAVRSLSRLKHDGELILILHDDSRDPEENRRVDECVKRIERSEGVQWRVLRRPDKSGGKPAAMQYVLEQTAHEHRYFLLADNDSYVCDREVLRRALPEFDDPKIAAVQFRNRARHTQEDGSFARCVAGAIDIFDAFATGLFTKLWRPFVGHNALLRTRAVLESGGFTPGFFADDIDVTVRMNLKGYRVTYRRDLDMQECHPTNYRSFALRSKKWAHGCAQILKTHMGNVLGSDAMTTREKLGFLLFTGFYVTQVAMLLYIVLVFMILPMLIGPTWKAAWWTLMIGTLVPISIFLPVVAYLLTEGRNRPFLPTLGSCAATYGSTDLWTILGLAGGFSRRKHGWIPTNSVLYADRPLLDWSHFAFGATVLLIPLAFQPELLLFPLTWLFAAKFLFVPAVAVHYTPAPATDDEPIPESGFATQAAATAPATTSCLAILAALAILAPTPTPALADDERRLSTADDAREATERPEHVRVEIKDDALLIDGEPIIIRGVHYGPWRPGTGPGRGFDYPSNKELREDLEMIASLHANTILVYDPPPRLLDLAEEYGLNVIYVFNIEWWRLSQDDDVIAEMVEGILDRVEIMHEKPVVIAWMLGNEAPGWILDELTPEGLRDFLADLRKKIREVDPYRPVTYGNWPPHRGLGIDDELDLVSYNVYPFYPTEVAVAGYGTFIRDELLPLAGNRPFLVTEFGLNTIEATPQQQAEVIRRCWEELLEAGVQGGVVFAFADEWWKNYDRPIRPPDWWRRMEDPEAYRTHHKDPEEHYGIVSAYRVPKPAFETVREMFAETADNVPQRAGAWWISVTNILWAIGTIAVFLLILTAVWLRVRGSNRAVAAVNQ